FRTSHLTATKHSGIVYGCRSYSRGCTRLTLQPARDELLRFCSHQLQVLSTHHALAVYFINRLCSRWSRREPTISSRYFYSANQRAICWSLSHYTGDGISS